MRGADLTGAKLGDADLTGADLGGADLSGAYHDENTEWPKGFPIPAHPGDCADLCIRSLLGIPGRCACS
ncbi:pentapeptide repeat-containing protein [Nocardia mangyaensis]|uniref:pentapeptide repeat-containing protein n=1 Tax=Nocardia mangyaensis TaxID=2213200 RepID=UPI000A07891F|nr:pentapeptide repeat-containing protein [Nocardia mangyaensis]